MGAVVVLAAVAWPGGRVGWRGLGGDDGNSGMGGDWGL